MPVPTAISDLSTTAASNSPGGSENVFPDLDNYVRAAYAFIAQQYQQGLMPSQIDLASATTTDIGGQVTPSLNITGTTTITSFGTNYKGFRYLRFDGALTLTHNATTLILPGGANITTVAGDTCIAVPNSSTSGTADGWLVMAYQRAAVPAIALLQTQTASSSSSISFTTGINSTYSKYVIEFYDLVPSTTATEIWLRVAIGGTFATANYEYGWDFRNTTTQAWGAGSNSDSKIMLINGMVATAAQGASGRIEIYNPSNTTRYKNIQWDITQNNGASARYCGGGSYEGSTSAIDGFRILMSSGNITSGTFKLYGVL